MSAWRANTTVSILQGVGIDEYDTDIDLPNPIQTGLPAFIQEVGNSSSRRDSNTPQDVRRYECKISQRARLRDDIRLLDERDGKIYIVDDYEQTNSAVRRRNKVLHLRRVR